MMKVVHLMRIKLLLAVFKVVHLIKDLVGQVALGQRPILGAVILWGAEKVQEKENLQ